MSIEDDGFVIRSSDSERGTIQVGGELDAHAANKLDDMVDELLAQGVTRLVMDIGGLTFIDKASRETWLHVPMSTMGGKRTLAI